MRLLRYLVDHRNFTRDLQEFRLSVTNQVYIDKAEYSSSRQLSLRISVSPEKDVEVRLKNSPITTSRSYQAVTSKLAQHFPAAMISKPSPSLILLDDLRYPSLHLTLLTIRQIQRHEGVKVVGSCHFP